MRLFHRLFLLFSLTAMIAALAMAGVLAWNLNRGFGEYLEARDEEMLDSFAADFENKIAVFNEASEAELDSAALKEIVNQMARQGRIRELPPGLGPRFETENDDPGIANRGQIQREREREGQREEGRPPPRIGGAGPERRGPPPDAFGARLRVFDQSGTLIFGPPFAPTRFEAQSSSHPIALGNNVIAFAQLLPRGPAPQSIDTLFIRGQYIGVAIVTALLIMLSAAFAWFLARLVERKITTVKDATTSISAGQLSTRVDLTGNDEFAQIARDINSMAESLGRLENARRRWLAEISHELRTPLTILRGELDALQDGIRPINIKAVESLSDEAERLHLLVEDLHFLAVSELGTPSQRLVSSDAVRLVHDIEDRFGRALADAGITLTVSCGSLQTLEVIWDEQRIEQMFGNLLTNTIRYTDAPGAMRITLTAQNGIADLVFEDSAPGVPAKHLSRLFTPLHRVEEARDRASGGSGLGLAVARAIVLAHRGSISAEPSMLGGLAIKLSLPINAGEE